MFDIYDLSTYNEVPEAYATVNGEKLYKNSDNSEYYTVKEITNVILGLNNYFKNQDPDFVMTKEGIDGFLDRLYLYNSISGRKKLEQEKREREKIITEQLKDICNDYSPKKSDLTIKGYSFTIAQKEMINHLSQEDKEKLVDVILSHFNKQEKRYRLSQEIFDNLPGKLDNMLFADLCLCKDIYVEKEVMEEYYTSFDMIKSKEELNELLNNEYLNKYPDLKDDVRKRLMINLGLN